MINIITNINTPIKCDINEALRYMGIKSPDLCDPAILCAIKECKKELENLSDFRACYKVTEIDTHKKNHIACEMGEIYSEKLYKHIKDCSHIGVFGATIGIEADRLIKKYSVLSPSKSVMCDALASSLTESWCDYVNAVIVEKKDSKSRFSPGYGDFHISYQKKLCEYLKTHINIGLSCTDYMMLTPTKSVTAIIGIKEVNSSEHT